MNSKQKILYILHRSPPTHGAAKVGDFIASSKKLNENFDCRFIVIKSSDTIGDIGKVNFKKFYLVAELYAKVLWALFVFRPDKLYYTASVRGVALYRDIFISSLWKFYSLIASLDIYYHYHTKGIEEAVSSSLINLKLTNFFLKDVNIILLSPLLKDDFKRVSTYREILFLPNGVQNPITMDYFNNTIENKFLSAQPLNVLYISNMIKSKGYFEVLKLATEAKHMSVNFHFAGSWQSQQDEREFFRFIEANNLSDNVFFHGFVSGKKKMELFKNANIFAFPTRYKNEAFPLSILESLSYGVPIIATNEGSIPFILDKRSGIVLGDVSQLSQALEDAKKLLVNVDSAIYCRQQYLDNFTLDIFDNNFIKILQK